MESFGRNDQSHRAPEWRCLAGRLRSCHGGQRHRVQLWLCLKCWLEVSRRAGGTLSARTEVDLEAVNANHVLFLLHSLGPNMCLRQLLQSSQLQRAWRAAFLKHVQGRHPGAWRWTHSGGGPYRAVIFDMGGVLLPSPGRVAAGELFILLHLGRPGCVG